MKIKRIIEIDEDTFKRIDEAKSVPDMFGTDIVNGLNTIKFSKPYDDSGDLISREALKKAETRPKGEWKKLYGNHTYCSKCKKDCEQNHINFCGYCGADMRGGAE